MGRLMALSNWCCLLTGLSLCCCRLVPSAVVVIVARVHYGHWKIGFVCFLTCAMPGTPNSLKQPSSQYNYHHSGTEKNSLYYIRFSRSDQQPYTAFCFNAYIVFPTHKNWTTDLWIKETKIIKNFTIAIAKSPRNIHIILHYCPKRNPLHQLQGKRM